MFLRSRGKLSQVAHRALLLTICVSVAVGSATQILLASLTTIPSQMAMESSTTPQSSLPEETPSESSDTSEPIEEGEVPFSTLRRTGQRVAHSFVQKTYLALFSCSIWRFTSASRGNHPTPKSRLERRYRNGCGADLRC